MRIDSDTIPIMSVMNVLETRAHGVVNSDYNPQHAIRSTPNYPKSLLDPQPSTQNPHAFYPNPKPTVAPLIIRIGFWDILYIVL